MNTGSYTTQNKNTTYAPFGVSVVRFKIRENLAKYLISEQELASLRDWLLPMLMNGQVKVGELESKVEEYVESDSEQVGMAAEIPRGIFSNKQLKPMLISCFE